MANKKRKNNNITRKKTTNNLFSRRILVFLLIAYLFSVLISQSTKLQKMIDKKKDLENRLSLIEEEIKALEEEVNNIDSLEFIEKVAREDLLMIKPREMLVIDEDKYKNIRLRFPNKNIREH